MMLLSSLCRSVSEGRKLVHRGISPKLATPFEAIIYYFLFLARCLWLSDPHTRGPGVQEEGAGTVYATLARSVLSTQSLGSISVRGRWMGWGGGRGHTGPDRYLTMGIFWPACNSLWGHLGSIPGPFFSIFFPHRDPLTHFKYRS